MDYYTTKTKIFDRIDRIIMSDSNLSREDILFDIMRRYGLGKKVVYQYIDILISRKMVAEKDNILTYIAKR